MFFVRACCASFVQLLCERNEKTALQWPARRFE